MGWITIKEYIQRFGISDSTIRRYIKTGQIRSKKIGSKWYVLMEDDSSENLESLKQEKKSRILEEGGLDLPKFPAVKSSENTLMELIAFSSKALNSYLMISDKLIGQQDKRIEDQEKYINEMNQKIAELESYIRELEENNGNS